MNLEKSTVHLLLVEDETVYSRMILYQLSKLEFLSHTISVNHVSSKTEMAEIKDFITPDIILLDLGLPECNGIDTFKAAQELYPNSAIIILTGNEDNALANALVKIGAQDFLVKADADAKVLRKAIEYSLDRVKFQKVISDSVLRYRDLFQNSPTALLLLQVDRRDVSEVNDALRILMECSDTQELIAKLENQFDKLVSHDLLNDSTFKTVLTLSTCQNKEIQVELIGSKLTHQEGSFVCQMIPLSANAASNVQSSEAWLTEIKGKTRSIKVQLEEAMTSEKPDIPSIAEQLGELEQLIDRKSTLA
jgi:DNA-binding NarL/FixJ family response regulator